MNFSFSNFRPGLFKRLAPWLLLLLGLAAASAAPAGPLTTVAAASDLKFPLDELISKYQAQTGQKVRAVYGSSGQLFTQISQGAPFDVFMSADETFVDQLAAQGMTQGRGVLYGIGKLVFFVPHRSAVQPDAHLADLARALADGRLVKFAIANPAHAPYGRAAQQVLESQGLWRAIEPRLVLGENVSQAAQFAVSGSTQGGIFALSLALAPAFASAGKFVEIPTSLHQPLRQRMVVLRRGDLGAQAFYQWLQQAPAREVLSRYGFALPVVP